MTEVEAIMIPESPTVELHSDRNSLNPTSPSTLLTMKSRVVIPPPGEFRRPDIYYLKGWRRFQYPFEEFWIKW